MQIVYCAIGEVKPYESNPNIGDIELVCQSIKTHGFRQPLLVTEQMVIICGHTRYQAARRLGLEEVPVIIASDLSDELVRSFRIADNQPGKLSRWDYDLLGQELAVLSESGFDVKQLGFDDELLRELLDGPLGKADPDDAPELPAESRFKVGDVIQLGSHLLYVGDCLSDKLPELFAGKKADLCFTDPPYNMNYVADNLGGILNDHMSDAQFVVFMLKSMSMVKSLLRRGGSYYICMSPAEAVLVSLQLRKLGMDAQMLIWAKPSVGMGSQEYRPQYEVILYGYIGSRRDRTWCGSRRESNLWQNKIDQGIIVREHGEGMIIEVGQGIETSQIILAGKSDGVIIDFEGGCSDIWQFARATGGYIHPTQKPVELVEHAICNSSKPGDLVFDPFGGSGTTLIACENTGRNCITCELDPRYADVIVNRYCQYTGKDFVVGRQEEMDNSRAGSDA